MGGQRVGMGGGNFGQWDGPGMRGGPIATETHLVPANRTGLVIGKGSIFRQIRVKCFVLLFLCFCFSVVVKCAMVLLD